MSKKLIFCIVLGLAVVAQAGPYSNAVIADNPMAYYQFEDATSGDGDVCADTMGNHPAAYISDTNQLNDVVLSANSWGAQMGNAATFAGTSGNGNGTGVGIQGGNTSGLELTTMSIEFLIKGSLGTNYDRIFQHNDGSNAGPGISICG